MSISNSIWDFNASIIYYYEKNVYITLDNSLSSIFELDFELNEKWLLFNMHLSHAFHNQTYLSNRKFIRIEIACKKGYRYVKNALSAFVLIIILVGYKNIEILVTFLTVCVKILTSNFFKKFLVRRKCNNHVPFNFVLFIIPMIDGFGPYAFKIHKHKRQYSR